MNKKLPAVIPLIKLRDNGSNPPETFYFGDDTHDCLLIENNAIIYHNHQNGEATFPIDPNEPNDSYEFVGEDDGYYLTVEMFGLEEHIDGFKAEIAALKAENERLKELVCELSLNAIQLPFDFNIGKHNYRRRGKDD